MFYSSFFSSSLQMPCRRSSYRVECEKKTINMRLRSFFLVLSSVSSTSSSSQLSFSIWIHEDQPLASHFESTKNRTNHFQTKAKCATNEQIYIWKKEPFFSLSSNETFLFCVFVLSMIKRERARPRYWDRFGAIVRQKSSTWQRTPKNSIHCDYILLFHSMAQLLNALSTCTVHIIYSLVAWKKAAAAAVLQSTNRSRLTVALQTTWNM